MLSRRLHKLTRVAHRLTRLELLITAAVLAVLCLYLPDLSPIRRRGQVRTIDENALEVWKRFIHDFPVQAKDRYAFKEMGFRTYMYAELLRKGSFNDAAGLEESLWHFTRDPGELRQQFGLEETPKSLQHLQSYGPSAKGIVTTVDQSRIRETIELISTLRTVLNCSLPIEIFHRGESGLPTSIREVITALPSIKTVDLDDLDLFDEAFLGHDHLTIKPESALQSLAMVASSFSQIIYIEPGTVFFSDPAELFGDRQFRSTGTLFFHGPNAVQQADSSRFLNYVRQQLDLASPSEALAKSAFYNYGSDQYQDPSVLLLDRSKPGVFAALLLNVWMHSNDVRNNIWHAHFRQTTSQTVWLSFEMADIPYAFVPSIPGAIGFFDGSFEDLPWQPQICPAHQLHFMSEAFSAPRGKPLYASGSLRLSQQRLEYLEVNAWASRGRWQETDFGLCLFDTTPVSAADSPIKILLEAHKVVDQAFQELFTPLIVQGHEDESTPY